jgi:hypothetical protein
MDDDAHTAISENHRYGRGLTLTTDRPLAHPRNQGRSHLPEQRPQQPDRVPLTLSEHRESSEREL